MQANDVTTRVARAARAGPTRLFVAVLLVLLLASCSAGPSGGGVSLRVTQFPWSAAKLTNAILAEIAAEHPELGVSGFDIIPVGTSMAWAGAQRGEVDLMAEVAMPNQQTLAAKAAAQMVLVHQTYGDAQQGWFVPTYALAPGQPLAGLRSVTQLNAYAGPLGGELVDSDPSFITTQQNAKRLAGYGIHLRQVTSSEAAQLAELRRAYERHQPILVYLYHPHWVFQEFQMTQLAEPNPPNPDCFTTGNGACAMPPYSAWTAAKKDLAQRAPRFWAMLQHFELTIPDVEAMLKSVDVDQQSAQAVAHQWVATHPQLIDQWTKA